MNPREGPQLEKLKEILNTQLIFQYSNNKEKHELEADESVTDISGMLRIKQSLSIDFLILRYEHRKLLNAKLRYPIYDKCQRGEKVEETTAPTQGFVTTRLPTSRELEGTPPIGSSQAWQAWGASAEHVPK